ncbi:MAG: hypothetical protein AAFQ73_04795, partial [Pseudomonadota bacterium]
MLAVGDHDLAAVFKLACDDPLIVLAGLLLIRMGWLIRRIPRKEVEEGAPDRDFMHRFVSTLGQAVIA